MLIEAGMSLASDLDLDAILGRIVRLASEITGARYAALGVLGADGRIERFVTEGLTQDERAAIGDPPTGHGVLGLLIEDAEPIRIDDVMTHDRAHGFPANHPPMHSFLGAPVKALGRIYGNIYLTEKRGAPFFDEEDEAALVVLATQAGVAIENARLYEESAIAQEELRRLEVLEERERIAKELHDGVIQSLFGVGMELQGASAMAQDERGPRPARARGRGHRSSDPRPAELHLRAQAGHPGRSPARPGTARPVRGLRASHGRRHGGRDRPNRGVGARVARW